MNVFGAKSVFARSPELSHMAFFDCHSVKSGAFQKCFFSPSGCDHERGV